jgi:hypothetical protein
MYRGVLKAGALKLVVSFLAVPLLAVFVLKDVMSDPRIRVFPRKKFEHLSPERLACIMRFIS